ncbi:hypothetical protein [Phenylobacterium conjunctum]|uniref:XRE family transcriptional regulator n=1 Tax=Phenylobacterium conjunctum TaxID=1298959 RepID=A0ABW3SXR9_9CAUL
MTVTHMEIRDDFGENLPGFELARARDALAKYVELRWPWGRRKAVAREWGLNDDEARSVCSGRASWATFDKIVTHPHGGWQVLLPVFAALLDQTAEQFIIEKRNAHAKRAERLGALVGDWWALPADPGVGAADDGRGSDRRPRNGPHRLGKAAHPRARSAP